MKRAKPHYDSDMRPMVLDLSIMFTIENKIPQKDRSAAIALYCFYYKHSVLQGTQSVWCQNRMVIGMNSDGSKNGKGFGWCEEKVSRIRKLLQECGLIEVTQKRTAEGRFAKKAYIRIHWYKSKETVEKEKFRSMLAERNEVIGELKQTLKQLQKKTGPGKNRGSGQSAEPRKKPDTVKTRVNAYSSSKVLNACNPKGTVAGAKSPGRRSPLFLDGKNKSKPKTGFSHDCAKKLYDALAAKRKIDRRANLSKWADSFRKLRDNHTKEEIEKVLAWYITNIGKPYVPEAHSADSFHEKFQRICEAIRRDKRDQTKEVRQQMREGTEDVQWPITWTDERGWKCELCSDGSWGCFSPTDSKGRSRGECHEAGVTNGLPKHLWKYTLIHVEQDEVYDDEGDIG